MTIDPVAATRASYEQVALDYQARTTNPDPDFVAFRNRFAAAVQGRVADLGCGPGQHAQALRATGLDVVGVDLTTAMLQLTAARGIPAVQGDLRALPLRAGAFGGLWSSASLLHVPRFDVPATLGSWHTLLRSGGVLGLSTSLGNQDGWEVVPYATPKPVYEDLHRWFVHHDEGELLDMLTEAGFTVTEATRRTSQREWLMVLATA